MHLNDARVDLYEKKKVNVMVNRIPTGETREDDILIGYGFTIEGAIKRIILNEIERKNETLELNEFLKIYKQLKEEIKL